MNLGVDISSANPMLHLLDERSEFSLPWNLQASSNPRRPVIRRKSDKRFVEPLCLDRYSQALNIIRDATEYNAVIIKNWGSFIIVLVKPLILVISGMHVPLVIPINQIIIHVLYMDG